MKINLLLILSDTKFLGLCLNNTMDWRVHRDHLMPKLSSAWHVVRTLKQIISQETFTIIYYVYFHSLMTYGIILWGNSPYSNHLFRLQKKKIIIIIIITIITDSKNRDSRKIC